MYERTGTPEPGDELQGEWTRERLVRMNACFVERLERAIARGDEHAIASGEERRAAPPGNREQSQSAAAPYGPD